MRGISIVIGIGLIAAGFSVWSGPVVKPGIQVLVESGFGVLQGKRVGLLTNPSGTDGQGRSSIDLLRSAKGVRLVSLFGPEHGIYGKANAGQKVVGGRDPRTGLPVHSLYGATRRPTAAMLKGLDALVYDLQDTGCRSYTFISTMGLAMEACGQAGVEFVVLDRPNPLGGDRVEGPMVEADFRSFVSQWDIPYVYGMTCGELASMIQAEGWIQPECRLTVVPMKGWHRGMVWRDTGLNWVPSSPNIPRADSPLYLTATGLFGEIGGGSGASIGIPFGQPFEVVVAPWLTAETFSRQMNGYRLPGVRFDPTTIDYRGKRYQGVRLHFTDPAHAPLVAINLYLLDAIKAVSGRMLLADATRQGRSFAMFDKVNGTDATRKGLLAGSKPSELVRSWYNDEVAFRQRRKPYLLYGRTSSPTAPAPVVSIPRTTRQPKPLVPHEPYHVITVRRGDTVTKISKDFGVRISDIVEANPGMDANRISVGQELRIPRRRDG